MSKENISKEVVFTDGDYTLVKEVNKYDFKTYEELKVRTDGLAARYGIEIPLITDSFGQVSLNGDNYIKCKYDVRLCLGHDFRLCNNYHDLNTFSEFSTAVNEAVIAATNIRLYLINNDLFEE